MVAISSIAIREDDGDLVVSAEISMPRQEGEAWYRLPVNSGTDIEGATDAFFVIGMILALGSDGVLTMDRPVSPRLAYNKRSIEEIFLAWYPDKLRAFEVDIPVRDADPAPLVDRTVSCFSGGVDSFDTLVNNSADIDALVFAHGFDIGLAATDILEATSAHLQEVAADTGKELIEVKTNIRRFLNRAASWPLVTHGAALASIGHLLSARFGRLLVPATYTYAEVDFPWGSHPLLDQRWSSNRLSVVDDGAGSSRVKKIIGFVDDQAARDHLRVCWQNTGKYNCGECEKCRRTMITLSIAGVLPEFTTFEREISLDDVRKMKVTSHGRRSHTEANLEFAEANGATEMAEILRGLITDYELRLEKKARSGDATAKKAHQGAGAASGTPASRKSLESRLAALEKRSTRVEKKVNKMQKLWPIRSWSKFASLRHGD